MFLKYFLLGSCLLIVNLENCNCAKILAIFPIGAKSQFFLGNIYLRALADAGHNVTMVSPFEDKTPTNNGSYTSIKLAGIYERYQEIVNIYFKKSDYNQYLSLFYGVKYLAYELKTFMELPQMQNLIKLKENFDVVVVFQMYVEGLKMFAHHFNAHLVVFNVGEPNFWTNPIVCNPSPPSYISEVWLGYPSKMTFWQRFNNVVFSWFADAIVRFYLIPIHEEILQNYFPKAPPLRQIIYNTSLVLLSSHESLNQPIPYVPVMKDVGGLHLKPPKPLPSDLQEYLDDAQEGVIYFSLGSNFLGKNMQKDKLECFLKTFTKLKYKVLWKFENDSVPEKPNNVKIRKWLPQNDVLAHRNIKVFITQAGYLSTTEALYHGVPIVALPIASDQGMVAKNAVEAGFGIKLPFAEVSEERLTAALNEILSNSKYSEAAKIRSKIIRDMPMKPTDTAVWWTEYIIRHNGARHLRVAGLEMPWYSYYSIDVYSILFLIIFVILFTFYKISKFILRALKSSNGNSKIKLD